jgi:membrane-associated protease RseP (regulator of RpoE activity)
MLKTLALVVAGLGVGFALAFWLLPGAPTAASDLATPSGGAVAAASSPAASTARLALLEGALAAEVEQRVALEARLGELAGEVEELRASAARAPEARGADQRDLRGPDAAAREALREQLRNGAPPQGEALERRQIDRLVAAGFAPDRAEWINRRTQELRVQQMQAQYEATRAGRPVDSAMQVGTDTALRKELGDAEYERYRDALNRSTSVDVMQVLASSPAESAGLRPGDQIVAYNGARVFDVAELNALTFQGSTGESVVVEIRRDGQPLQLVVPRGPLGITGGFRGPPIPIGR